MRLSAFKGIPSENTQTFTSYYAQPFNGARQKSKSWALQYTNLSSSELQFGGGADI